MSFFVLIIVILFMYVIFLILYFSFKAKPKWSLPNEDSSQFLSK